jgi:hypothetical protein
MFMDTTTEFCSSVDVSASAGTALVGNQIDLGSAGINVGMGQPLYLVIRPNVEIITGGVAGTIQFVLASDSTAVIDTATSTRHLISPEYVTDDSAANDDQLNINGYLYMGAIPSDTTYEQFLGILVVTGTTATVAGSIDAYLTLDPSGWKSYPDAVN